MSPTPQTGQQYSQYAASWDCGWAEIRNPSYSTDCVQNM
jgi:hypothetical protein